MPQSVDIPGQGTVDFPDEMTPDQIKGVIQNKFFEKAPEATATPTPSPTAAPTPPEFAPGSPREIAREQAAPYKEQVQSFLEQPIGGRAPRIPEQTNSILAVGAGLLNTLFGAGEALATPKNIALGAATIAAPEIVKPAAGAAFATSAFADIPTTVKEAFAPGTSFQRGVELGGRALTDILFGITGMKFGAEIPKAVSATPITDQAAATVQPKPEEVIPSATQERQIAEGGQPEYTGIPPGTGVPPNAPEVRETEGGLAGGGGGVEPTAPEQAIAQPGAEAAPAAPEPAKVTPEAAAGGSVPPAIGKDVLRDLPDVPEEEKRIGLTKDYISTDRAARGEPPLEQEARQTNPETWENAAQVFARNPNAGHELVASLIQNPRTLDPNEVGVLLRHRVDLSNQTDLEYSRLTSESSTPSDKGEASSKLLALNDARNQADIATSGASSQMGRSFQFLQQISANDYSLSGMIQQRRVAAGGKELTPEQTAEASEYSKEILAKDAAWQDYLKTNARTESALEAYKTRLRTATTDIERRIAFSEFEPEIRRQMELDPEAQKLKGERDAIRAKWENILVKDQLANRPTWQKILGGVAWGARESALSGYHTLEKLAGFTGGKLAELPLTQTAERVWGMIPGFKEIAAKSEFGPGANAQALGKLYSEFFTTGMKQAFQQLRSGTSDFKAQYGDDKIGLNYPSYFGNLHGAEKTPLRVGATAMYRQRIVDSTMERLASQATAEGHDVTDPVIQGAINKLSFDAATDDILMGNNLFADKVNGLLRSMEGVQKKTGQPSIELNILSTLAKTFLTKGIVRTPANFVTQVFERTPVGLARGIARGGRAIYQGVENVPPGERTAIMKLLGVGSVGSAMFLWGALDALRPPDKRMFGGYYQPGEQRDTNDVKWGSVRLEGYTAPHYLTHNLLSEPAQMGNTMMRVATSSLSKKDRTNKGAISGMIASTLGLAEQAPIANPAFRLQKLTDPRQQSSYFGDTIRGLIPQMIQNIAEDMDKSDVVRKPSGVLETAKLGIPGLREQVPEKKSKTKAFKGL